MVQVNKKVTPIILSTFHHIRYSMWHLSTQHLDILKKGEKDDFKFQNI